MILCGQINDKLSSRSMNTETKVRANIKSFDVFQQKKNLYLNRFVLTWL